MSFHFLLQIETVATTQTAVKEISLGEIISQSNAGIGWLINILLLAIFGYVAYIFVERFMMLRRASREEDDFFMKIKSYLLDGKLDEAKKHCEHSESPVARILEKGISRIGKPLDSISNSIENIGKLEIMRMERRLSFLATASGAGPMLGFLGTAVGMVIVFIDLQSAATLELKVIAPGMMTAMVTTVEGLIVGLLAYLGYNFLVDRINKIVYQMESAALDFMDILNQPSK
jgi:biopolymer transport protein ExbB